MLKRRTSVIFLALLASAIFAARGGARALASDSPADAPPPPPPAAAAADTSAATDPSAPSPDDAAPAPAPQDEAPPDSGTTAPSMPESATEAPPDASAPPDSEPVPISTKAAKAPPQVAAPEVAPTVLPEDAHQAPPPTIKAVSPKLICPGSMVAIAGTAFQKKALVFVGGKPCTKVNIVNPKLLSCIAPVHTAGTAPVQVVNPDHQEARFEPGFTYYVDSILVSPSSKVVAAGKTYTFRAYGGAPPYSYSVSQGAGTIDPKTGAYTAPPDAGTAQVTVTDFLGNTADAEVVISPPLAINPTNRDLNVGGTGNFSAVGGAGPYTYSVVKGTGSVDETTGRFTAPVHPEQDTVRVTDAFGNTNDATVSVSANLALSPAESVTAVDDKVSFSATGGAAPYQFELSGPGEIDPKTGVYTASGGTGKVTVTATDQGGNKAQTTLTVNPKLEFDLSVKVIGTLTNTDLKPSGGVPPYTFTVDSGSGSIDPSGHYAAPSDPGTAIARVKDSAGSIAEVMLTINPQLAIHPARKKIWVNRIIRLTATGGSPPYTYSIASGGGALDPKLGVYVAPGDPGPVTIRATDSEGTTSDASLDISEPTDQLVAGAAHTCSLVKGRVKCWGDNARGELGVPTAQEGFLSAQVTGLESDVDQIAAGQYHTCALVKGSVRCWGFNASGQLGNDDTKDSFVPVDVHNLSGVQMIAAGQYHTCALTGGVVKCWGNNLHGQLGDGTRQNALTPVTVKGLNGVKAITAGVYHTCALLDSGVKCWGQNFNGQLGDGTKLERHLPVDVIGLPQGIEEISAGGFHTCALTQKKRLYCWGDNYFGQLGDGTHQNHTTPTPVKKLPRTIESIAAGVYHTCVQVKGQVKCWGQNANGQLGTRDRIASSLPRDVSNLSCGTQTVGAGTYHTCAIVFGNVKCWGDNSHGELGSTTVRSALAPIRIAPMSLALPRAKGSEPKTQVQ